MNPPASARDPWARNGFRSGIAVGLLFSIVFYAVIASVQLNSAYPLFGAVTIKLVAGIALSLHPQWKAFGAGLLASMPIGALIFATLCFGSLLVFSL
jgi:hypothetical protein